MLHESTKVNAARWKALWSALQMPAPLGWHERLLQCYAEPQRHYHTSQHLSECLHEFDEARGVAADPAMVELAIWFHDAVYDPRASDNEERSAELIVQCLQSARAGEAMQDLARRLVLATKHHIATTPDEALLIDVDLSILGQPPERFAEYEMQIRQEYSWVPENVFTVKRSEVLQQFLARPRIYTTGHFFSRYEHRAKNNLSASLKSK
jgi:predicted metal-dependent HD superfamily phosphohydrolase